MSFSINYPPVKSKDFDRIYYHLFNKVISDRYESSKSKLYNDPSVHKEVEDMLMTMPDKQLLRIRGIGLKSLDYIHSIREYYKSKEGYDAGDT